MGKIVAIGGGEIRKGQTRRIDEFIVSLAKKNQPTLLFIPTASFDAPAYVIFIESYFSELGCSSVDKLLLHTQSYSDNQIKDKILAADIIYVGGGHTEMMLSMWKKYHVDDYLKLAYERDVVLSGLSAGSICWFEQGYSDSDSFENEEDWSYKFIEGLGFINGVQCPHYNEAGYKTFDSKLSTMQTVGIALENNTALVEIDGQYQVIKSNPQAKAYLISKTSKKELVANETFVF